MKGRLVRHLTFHFIFYLLLRFFFFLHCVFEYGRLFALGAKGRAEEICVFFGAAGSAGHRDWDTHEVEALELTNTTAHTVFC